METIILDWSSLPAMMYMPLDKFYETKEREGFYFPSFGSGVYLFVYPTKVGYQVYYVGQSEKIGCRLVEHIEHYIGKRTPHYYLPTAIDYYNEDVYKYFRLEKNEGKLSDKISDFTEESYSDIGKKIIENTYFCFAKLRNADEAFLKEVEGVLLLAVLKKNELPRVGWIGDGQLTRPEMDITIENHYSNKTIRKIISTTLPEKIQYTREDGNLVF